MSSVLAPSPHDASVPYHDPLGKLNWEAVDRDAWWLPPEALSLAGVPEFEALPIAARRRLSQYELAHLLETGLWLESLFISRLAAQSDATDDIAVRRRLLQEIREEAGHSLMFLELMTRSGVAIPGARAHRPRFAQLVGRLAPADGLLFWATVVAGEELPHRMNRALRRGVEDATLSAVVYHMTGLHMHDEAHHIAHARLTAESLAAAAPAWRRRVAAALVTRVFDPFVRHVCYPHAQVYALALGGAGERWRPLAAANPRRRALVAEAIRPTLAFFERIGLAVASRHAAP
jgi:hypothetical protein